MKFTATISARLLKPLGTREECEVVLRELFLRNLKGPFPPEQQVHAIKVEMPEVCTLEIELELYGRDVETVKDILHESLEEFLNPDFQSDISVEIDDEL